MQPWVENVNCSLLLTVMPLSAGTPDGRDNVPACTRSSISVPLVMSNLVLAEQPVMESIMLN